VDRAYAGNLAKREDVAERRIIAEIESQSRGIQEDEFSRDPKLELALFKAQLLGYLRELGKSFLDGAVLEGVKLDGAQSGVKGDHEVPSATTDVCA
jgi:hypothetical protein